MIKIKKHLKSTEFIFPMVCLAGILILLFLPTGFEKQLYVNSEMVKGKVVSTNEEAMYTTGLITQGDQVCEVEIQQGTFKGEVVNGVNIFTGKLEFDKVFTMGDSALVLIEKDSNGNLIYANMIDYYRLDKEIILILIFILSLILFSGITGLRTIISFIFTLVSIWKILIPFLLKGYNPMIVAFCIGIIITIITVILVAGFTKISICSILGALNASIFTCIMAFVFGNLFKIDGTVMNWSESLLYAGFENLNLTLIFQSGIYLSCSGAILDLAVDISAAIDEVVNKKPDISKKEILLSGFKIGKSVVGSQTSTLILAYMGSFIAIMMVYMAQGTPLLNIINSKTISAEILNTFVGCLGLVLVSPITSIICTYVYKINKRNKLIKLG